MQRKKADEVIAAYARDPERVLRRRTEIRLSRIGLSLKWFDNLSREGCGICKTPKPGGNGNWHIDHDHSCCPGEWWQSCGECIRGLLCHHCNIGLGHFFDDPENLLSAAAWIVQKAIAA